MSKKILVFSIMILIVNSIACQPKLSATQTPYVTKGTSVFYAWGLYAEPDYKIDVVFVPEQGYGVMTNVNNLQNFLDDVSAMIGKGFFQNNAITRNWYLYNFWYMTDTGTVQAPPNPCPPGQDCRCPTVTWPDLTDASFAEVIILLHNNPLRDCAWGNLVTSEPYSYNTVIHESSHATFSLPDEYCCDGGYWNSPPILYSNKHDCNNDQNNADWRNCTSFTSIWGDTWWRSEDNTDDIMSVGSQVVLEYGHADWAVARPVLEGLGETVTEPTVFAPNTWDRPWQP